jgi:hypothetical protein
MRSGDELHDHSPVLDALDGLVSGVHAQFLAYPLFDGDLPAFSDSAGHPLLQA